MMNNNDALAEVHPTAIIEDGAVVGQGTRIGAYSVVGPEVVIGKNCQIAPHVVIEGNTRIGDENKIFQFASVGAEPQDLKYKGEDSLLQIGNGNRIREYVTLQPGTEGGGMLTSVGNNNLFMACSHVGHDAIIGNSNIFANSAALAGHVEIGDYVVVGGMCGVHQFVKIGDVAMLGAGAMVAKDIPPYCIAQGDRAGLVGIHKIGLERHGFSSEEISGLRKAFRDLFLKQVEVRSEKLETLKEEYKDQPVVSKFLDFISESKRGIAHLRKQSH